MTYQHPKVQRWEKIPNTTSISEEKNKQQKHAVYLQDCLQERYGLVQMFRWFSSLRPSLLAFLWLGIGHVVLVVHLAMAHPTKVLFTTIYDKPGYDDYLELEYLARKCVLILKF